MYTRIQLSRQQHAVDSDPTQLAEYKWCVDTFKLPSDLREWYVNSRWSTIEFNFSNPVHATMFAMRWA
jgi:hypothetical protein